MNFEEKINWTEKELIELCVRENRTAQKVLYDRYSRVMFGVCMRYMENYDLAQDVMQEGFIKVFRHLKSYSGEGSFEGWMRRVFANCALEELRKNNILRNSSELMEADVQEDPDWGAIDRVSIEEIHRTIAALPTGFRTVFNMYAIEGYSHKEIGEALGIEESTSRSQFTRAKQLLRSRLEKLGYSSR